MPSVRWLTFAMKFRNSDMHTAGLQAMGLWTGIRQDVQLCKSLRHYSRIRIYPKSDTSGRHGSSSPNAY